MLILLALLSLLVFLVPGRYKYGYTYAVIAAGAVTACLQALASSHLPLRNYFYQADFSALFRFDYPEVDKLSSFFMVLASLAMVAVMQYAGGYLKSYRKKKSDAQFSVHFASLALLYFSMLFVLMFRGAFPFLLSWELMTVASFLLILFEGEKREIRRAAINYLILMHIGFVLILSGFVVGSEGGELTGFRALAGYFSRNHPVPLFLLFLGGFGMKAGIFPLHVWLPEAHPAAPSHVSALMSGVMIKMGVYGILRVVGYMQHDFYTVGVILLCIGMVTALWGIVFASLQNDMKKLLAYSSVENIGIIFTAIGIALMAKAQGNHTVAVLGFAGALLHTLNHSFFKPVLFMCAGNIYKSTHTRSIDDLGGIGKRMPLTAFLFLVGSMAICALPPFNGFVSEFLIYLGFMKSIGGGQLVLWPMLAMAVFALVGGLALLVFSKAFGITFLGISRDARLRGVREVGTGMLAGAAIPLAGILLVSVCPVFFFRMVSGIAAESFSVPFSAVFHAVGVSDSLYYIPFAMGLMFLIGAALWLWRRNALAKRTVDRSYTWGCGFTATSSKMQYTGESFSEGVECLAETLAPDTRKRRKKGRETIGQEEIFAVRHSYRIEHKDRIDRLIAERWGYFIRKINGRLALFQTGKINHYILHALVFLGLVLLLTFIGLI